MLSAQKWVENRLGRRVTVQEIADAIGVSRVTATKRLGERLGADDTIRLAAHFELNPADALIATGYLTVPQVQEALPDRSRPVASLTAGELALELTRRLNTHPSQGR